MIQRAVKTVRKNINKLIIKNLYILDHIHNACTKHEYNYYAFT